MKRQLYLRANDTIGIVSTARKMTLTELQPAINLIVSWGFKVKIGETIGLENDQFAGTDAERASDFQKLWNDKEVKAIWCARGGYGTVRMVDLLDFSAVVNSPKWLIGYSDITVLHSELHNRGMLSIHATMPVDIKRDSEEAISSLRQTLLGESVNYNIPSSAENRPGVGEGILVGGNLSVLYSLLGSPSSVSTKGKILFLEDLDEYLYHIDRMIQNLRRNGYLNELAGLIVGSMTDMHDNSVPFGKNVKEIILEATSNYDYPICFDFPAGHLDDNRALTFGRSYRLDVGPEMVDLTYATRK